MDRRSFIAGLGAGLVSAASPPTFAYPSRGSAPSVSANMVSVDFSSPSGPFPHFWEAAGSDRTIVGLRKQWQDDLIRVHRDTGIGLVRSHGLFDDEMGIAAHGAGTLNFLYVDQVYDFMLDHGVRPFVELSFMPEAFASSANRVFSYKGNTSPPRDWNDWRRMVQAFAEHCVLRYGLSEVSGWRFEVWNEPNIVFWAGSQDDYFELYRQSALAIKAVNKSLQVGGPATAELDWIPDLIRYCVQRDVPLDFLTSHIYPGDPQKHIFGRDHFCAFEQVIPRGIKQVAHQIASSGRPQLPLWITEWSSQNPAFIADTIKNCIGLTETMSYWTFSNVFEENGVPSGIFNDTYGLTDQWGIARPSLHTFTLLHRLGTTRLRTSEGPVLATQRVDGSFAVMVWNLLPSTTAGDVTNGNPIPSTSGASAKAETEMILTLQVTGLTKYSKVQLARVGGATGSARPAWEAMGRPQYPTQDQIKQLRAAAEMPEPEKLLLTSPGNPPFLTITLPPNGVALLEFVD